MRLRHPSPSSSVPAHASVAALGYVLSPRTHALANGWFASSVSIRSPLGGDRLLRLTRIFRDSVAACEYAVAEGLQWIGAPRAPAAA